ncbi:DUF362 domain-containing protein, partial [candidate division WOR-3 bacterium]|nr:DUF362 domain-containing protein [candidate division WOR-3 bacterium]
MPACPRAETSNPRPSSRLPMSCTSCPASSPGPGRERVLVRKVSDLPAAVTEALDFLEYDFRDRKVWVKPNLLSPRPPADSVTTQPELIRLVVRELRRRGAAEVWVSDNPGGRLQGDVASYIAPTGAVEASEGCFVEPARDPVLLPLKSRFV